MNRVWIFAIALSFSLPVLPGEIIGNTYIGEKNGYIEIQSPGGKWQIVDREGQGPSIANLTVKDPIKGSRPTLLFQGIPKMGGITLDQIMQMIRTSVEQQGLELGPVEMKRYGGKQIATFNSTLTKQGIKVVMNTFICEGPKNFFMATGSAVEGAYEGAKPMFEEVIEKLKY